MSIRGPIPEEFEQQIHVIAGVIHDILNPEAAARDSAGNTGWCLLVFPFGEPGQGEPRMSFASNANPEDLIKALEELASRMKGDHPEERKETMS